MPKEPEPYTLTPQEIDALRRSVDRQFLERLFREIDGTQSVLPELLSAEPYEPPNNWKNAILAIGRDLEPGEWAKRMSISPRHFLTWCEERGLRWGQHTAPNQTLLARLRRHKAA